MLMALSPEVEGGGNYYRYRDDQDDGGYLDELVETCQDVLKKTKHYDKIVLFFMNLLVIIVICKFINT